MNYAFNFNVIWANAGNLLGGLALGLALAFFAIAIGAVIGLVAPSPRSTGRAPLRKAAAAYVTFVRNTPLLVIVLVAYFALPEFGIRMGKLESFVASLALYAGAYLTEVFRASLIGIPAGPHRRRPFHRPDAAAGGAAGPLSDHAAQRAAGARLDLHLAVQGHLDRRGDRRARTHLPGAPHQRR